VPTLAIGEAGAKNAALFAVRMLATSDQELRGRLKAFHQDQETAVLGSELE
jgi:5-(carboxyamino)imidazole ribonucleotide mutase